MGRTHVLQVKYYYSLTLFPAPKIVKFYFSDVFLTGVVRVTQGFWCGE